MTAAVWLGGAGDAAANDRAPDPVREPDSFLGRLRRAVDEALEDASAARAPAPVPPQPIPVSWRARRLTSIDLGAPLLALAGGDLDGDGRAELVAVTERDVVVLAARGRRALGEVARAPLPPDPQAIRPRDAVGAAVVVAGAAGARAELWARASTSGRGARYQLEGGELREVAPAGGYPLCARRSAELAPGRNYFAGAGGDGDLPERYYGLRCRDDLVDEQGRAMSADAALATDGTLAVRLAVRCTTRDAGCTPAAEGRGRRERVHRAAIAGVGTAFEIADVDRDGRPEIIHAGAGAPGDPDAVVVEAVPPAGAAAGKVVFRRDFKGGVAGIVAADVDGDRDLEVIAAVRLPGAERVDLWLLD